MQIVGITDGSNAPPGIVGEWVEMQSSRTYGTGPSNDVMPVTLGVLTPGDWDIYCFSQATTNIDGLVFEAIVQPGMQGNLQGSSVTISAPGAIDLEYPIVNGYGRGNFTVPTLISFNVQVYMASATGPGTAYMTVQARRAR